MSADESAAAAEAMAVAFLQQTQALAMNFFLLFEFKIFIVETNLDLTA